jgi:hypothetical protein
MSTEDDIEKAKKNPQKTASDQNLSKKSKTFALTRIPLLNKDTVSIDTYDFGMLLDFKVQKEALSTHRIKKSTQNSLNRNLNPKTFHSSKKTPTSPCVSTKSNKDNEGNSKNEKIQKIKEELSNKERQECTFAPKIIGKRKIRSPDEYYKDQLVYQNKKNEKIKEKQKELSQSVITEASTFSHVPEITEKSSQIASKHIYGENKYDRLSKGLKPPKPKDPNTQETKSSAKSPTPVLTFTPELNLRSKNLLRIAPIEEILYEDALRRQKQKNEEKVYTSSFSPLNANSEKLLIEKFYKEFTEVCDLEQLNFSDFKKLLNTMYFVLNFEKNKQKELELANKLWKNLSEGNESVSSEKVIMHFLAVMKYQSAVYTNSDEAISPEETDYIHSQYFLFYENRQSVINKSSVNRSVNAEENSFIPEICPKSRAITQHISLDKINQKKSQKKMEMIKEVEEKTLEECTFQPTITLSYQKNTKKDIKSPILKEYLQIPTSSAHRGELLYNYSTLIREKKEMIMKQEKLKTEEKELAECTFAPKIDFKNPEKSNLKSKAFKKTGNSDKYSQAKDKKFEEAMTKSSFIVNKSSESIIIPNDGTLNLECCENNYLKSSISFEMSRL